MSAASLRKGSVFFLLSVLVHFAPRNSAIPNTLSPLKNSYCSSATSLGMSAFADLGKVPLMPVKDGALEGSSSVTSGISSRFKSGEYKGATLFAVIKELAPVKGAETDKILGVGEFQSKYFLDYPVYLDSTKAFYAALGNKSLFAQPLTTWNPFKLYADYQEMTRRMKSSGIEGNMVGEGLIQGGVLVISPSKGVVYTHNEKTGSLLPFVDMQAALDSL